MFKEKLNGGQSKARNIGTNLKVWRKKESGRKEKKQSMNIKNILIKMIVGLYICSKRIEIIIN